MEERTYGAVELKALYGRFLARGLWIAVAIHLLVIAGYYAAEFFGTDEPPAVHVRLLRYSELGPPPSIAGENTPPPVALSAPKARPGAGVPVPVPDIEVSPEQTLATQHEMNLGAGPGGTVGGTGEGTGVAGDITIQDDESPPADYVAVEKEPVIIRSVEPKYPDMAVRTGQEGKVWVKIWVDREGRPKDVEILQSDAEIFNEAAIEAAKQFLFTPAYMNDGPVSVWVTFPFKFELSGAK
ncbi:MAG TPA: energy transducer TonB [Bacteroidota bacterium]|nr:energy transducer TonB [Bacteroidota bacterium]